MAHDAMRSLGLGTALAAGLGAAAALATPAPVEACGGLFCSAANPVNQAAEQIIFSDNGDGTVTAVIQILYEGPAHAFAWVLPIPGNPTVGVSSTQALDTLKQATNPIYQLNTVLSDSCFSSPVPGSPSFGSAGSGGSTSGAAGMGSTDGGVTVLASGAIGPYLYDTIAVDPTTADAAQAAIDWLEANNYDVGDIGPDVLRPYLADGLNLIAFKLDPVSDTGSIRPVMITYEASQPSIPIRPTAVAANDDMGVLVYLLSDTRGIPENYKALELNEALIDWFNANNNYNDVVTRAADLAAGQGFTTEFAGRIDGTGSNPVFVEVFAQWQQDTWANFQATPHTDPFQMVQDAQNNWGGFDGMDEAFASAVTLPAGISLDDFKNCMMCYINQPGVVFDTTKYLQGLYEMVVKPMIETQKLLDARPYMTRLYTTMSAEEMTMDPVFSFNADLDTVSNFHSADRVIDCTGGRDPFASGTPWTVTLPQGDVVHGDEPGVWPVGIETQPAAAKILQYASEGAGELVEDNSDLIAQALDKLGGGSSGDAGSSGGSSGSAGRGGSSGRGGSTDDGGVTGPGGSGSDDAGLAGAGGSESKGSGSWCSAAGRIDGSGLWVLGLSLAALVRRRRRAA